MVSMVVQYHRKLPTTALRKLTFELDVQRGLVLNQRQKQHVWHGHNGIADSRELTGRMLVLLTKLKYIYKVTTVGSGCITVEENTTGGDRQVLWRRKYHGLGRSLYANQTLHSRVISSLIARRHHDDITRPVLIPHIMANRKMILAQVMLHAIPLEPHNSFWKQTTSVFCPGTLNILFSTLLNIFGKIKCQNASRTTHYWWFWKICTSCMAADRSIYHTKLHSFQKATLSGSDSSQRWSYNLLIVV